MLKGQTMVTTYWLEGKKEVGQGCVSTSGTQEPQEG